MSEFVLYLDQGRCPAAAEQLAGAIFPNSIQNGFF